MEGVTHRHKIGPAAIQGRPGLYRLMDAGLHFAAGILQDPLGTLGEVEGQCTAFALVLSATRGGVLVLVGASHQGVQKRQLLFGALHRLIRARQILKVVDNLRYATCRIGRFQHVAANKIVEIPHRLQGNRLVEQLHRLRRRDPQQAAHVASVLGESRINAEPALPQAGAQRLEIIPKITEILCNTEALGTGDIEALRLPDAVLLVENLSHRHRLPKPLINENPQDHRV